MPAPRLIVVTGTGTEIGKTHTSVALLKRWARSARVRGLKPIETGVRGSEGEDARALRLASSVPTSAPFGETFLEPISPHLAARREGRALDLGAIALSVQAEASKWDGALVELAGGLFSPLGRRVSNLDLALLLRPTATLLVAPDRLGVLHDIGATTRAAASSGLVIDALALVTPAEVDTSTGANAAEVGCVTDVPVAALIPRATVDDLSVSTPVEELLRLLLAVSPRA